MRAAHWLACSLGVHKFLCTVQVFQFLRISLVGHLIEWQSSGAHRVVRILVSGTPINTSPPAETRASLRGSVEVGETGQRASVNMRLSQQGAAPQVQATQRGSEAERAGSAAALRAGQVRRGLAWAPPPPPPPPLLPGKGRLHGRGGGPPPPPPPPPPGFAGAPRLSPLSMTVPAGPRPSKPMTKLWWQKLGQEEVHLLPPFIPDTPYHFVLVCARTIPIWCHDLLAPYSHLFARAFGVNTLSLDLVRLASLL